jgi:hypothetical protein
MLSEAMVAAHIALTKFLLVDLLSTLYPHISI